MACAPRLHGPPDFGATNPGLGCHGYVTAMLVAGVYAGVGDFAGGQPGATLSWAGYAGAMLNLGCADHARAAALGLRDLPAPEKRAQRIALMRLQKVFVEVRDGSPSLDAHSGGDGSSTSRRRPQSASDETER